MAIIAKGNQRSGGRQLAAHLLNARDNERVELAELRGTAAPDLKGAFAEWEVQADATRCRQLFYHLSVSPDHAQGVWGEADYYDFLDQAEQRLGLDRQARAVLFHVKEGRHHCHCVWNRIDAERGKAVHLSNDRQILRSLVQDVAQERGLQLPDGLQQDKGAARTGDQHTNQAEQKQQERSGLTKAERMAFMTEAWGRHPEAGAFVAAIEEGGFTLARGSGQQRKDGKASHPVYVVVDGAGEVHSLARQIQGAKAKEIFTRLQDGYALDSLQDAATAKTAMRPRPRQQTMRPEFGLAAAPALAPETAEPEAGAAAEQPEVFDRDAENAAWQAQVDAAGIAYEEEQRQQFYAFQQAAREVLERQSEAMTARHAETLTQAFQRHAEEGSAEGATADHQPTTAAEAEQAVSTSMSFFLSIFASIAESVTNTGRPKRDRPKTAKEKKAEEQKRQAQREKQARELEDLQVRQARERQEFEQQRSLLLFEQARGREYFEQEMAARSSVQHEFRVRTDGLESYREALTAWEPRRVTPQPEQKGPSRDGPELEL